ncbi:MAG: EAL domain-containing protein [Aeromicrobium sp.]
MHADEGERITTSRGRGERRFEQIVMALALLSFVFRSSQWRLGPPDITFIAVVALALVPLAVRTQIRISRGRTDLTLGASAAALFASDVVGKASVLPIWAVLVSISYAAFHRDETWGQFRAAIQILGGAALIRAAEITQFGVEPYTRVFTGLSAYFIVITILELGRRVVAPSPDEGRALRLRWSRTLVVGLSVFYVGCALAALRRLETGIELPVVSSLVVLVVGLSAIVVGQLVRVRELSRSVLAISGASVAMPWRRDEIDETMGAWGAKGLRANKVVVRDGPGSRWDFSVRLNDGRHVVAERSSGDLPFSEVERNVLQALANMCDASRRESDQLQELHDRANTDGLTGLPNYTYFRDVLAEVSRTRHEGESIAIVFIDLDGFKEINDRFGHLTGDRAIQILAERLIEHLGDAQTVTRFGGDEFAVLMRDVRDYTSLLQECERLAAVVTEPIVIGRDTLHMRASFGSAMSTSADDNLEELVRAADQQMYQRKRAVHAGDGEVTSRVDEAVRLAIVTGTIRTAFQPIVRVDVDEVRGVEALVRCTDPQLGSIPPQVIVESAIRLNMLDDMSMHVLEQSIDMLTAAREFVPDLFVFTINLELEQMMTWTPLLERIATCKQDHGLVVVVEISERSIGFWSDANAHISLRLQKGGALIAIDDFGAGHAGIGSLYLPRVDIVKLDRSLLASLADPRQTLVVTRTTAMLNELGFWVIAEGVTTDEEVVVLRDAGATHLQGYLYGMPEDGDAMVQRFRDHGLAPLVHAAAR